MAPRSCYRWKKSSARLPTDILTAYSCSGQLMILEKIKRKTNIENREKYDIYPYIRAPFILVTLPTGNNVNNEMFEFFKSLLGVPN